MADTTGFLKYRPASCRRGGRSRCACMDWKEVYVARRRRGPVFPIAEVRKQAARCMDCGIPFCHHGCPVGNLIPEWNDLARRDAGATRSSGCTRRTTSPSSPGGSARRPARRPACSNCSESPVTIKQIEWEIIDRAFDEGWVTPQPPAERTGRKVAVVGSGPAGLAAAQQLTRAGHDVTVFERGRPHRRPAPLRHPRVQDGEGRPRPAAGPDARRGHPVRHRRRGRRHRATTTCRPSSCAASTTPSCWPAARRRPRPAGSRAGTRRHPPGHGVPALRQPRRRSASSTTRRSTPRGKHVVIIGGGDTGADCLGTAHRQGAASVTQLEIMPAPPDRRDRGDNPWPTYPMIMRVSSAHEEGGERLYSVNTERFLGDDARQRPGTAAARGASGSTARFQKVEGTERELPRRPGLPRHGLHRRRSARAWSTSSASRSTSAATWRGTPSSCPPCRVSSWPATWAAVSR